MSAGNTRGTEFLGIFWIPEGLWSNLLLLSRVNNEFWPGCSICFFQSDLEKLHILSQCSVLPTVQCSFQTGWMCVPFPPGLPSFSLPLIKDIKILNRTNLEDVQLCPAHRWSANQYFQSQNPGTSCSMACLGYRDAWEKSLEMFSLFTWDVLDHEDEGPGCALSTLSSLPSALTGWIEPKFLKRFMRSILFYCWCFLFFLSFV